MSVGFGKQGSVLWPLPFSPPMKYSYGTLTRSSGSFLRVTQSLLGVRLDLVSYHHCSFQLRGIEFFCVSRPLSLCAPIPSCWCMSVSAQCVSWVYLSFYLSHDSIAREVLIQLPRGCGRCLTMQLHFQLSSGFLCLERALRQIILSYDSYITACRSTHL